MVPTTTETGTDRRKREFIKQITSTGKNIDEINKLILEEKRLAIKQYTKYSETMFRTPPKKPETDFRQSPVKTDEQPVEPNLETVETAETDNQSNLQSQASNIMPSVAFTITLSTDKPITRQLPFRKALTIT